MDLRALRQEKAGVVEEMKGLVAKAEQERRAFSDEENQKFETLKEKANSLNSRIKAAEAVQDEERSMQAMAGTGHDSYEQRAGDFSICRAIAARIEPGSVDDGFEREISKELARRSGRTPQGIFVPHEVFKEKRAVTTGGTGSNLVPTQHRDEWMIDVLRESLLMNRLGATILDGLVGDQEIPRLTASATSYHIDEHSTDVTVSDHTFDSVSLSATTVGALVEYSRRMLLNAVPSVERLIRRDLARVIAEEIDKQALIGDGTSNKPTGITNTSGINSISFGGDPTWAKVLEFITALQVDKALAGGLNWVSNPYAVKKMRSTLKESGDAGAGYIMESAAALAGYPLYQSNNLAGDPNSSPAVSGELIFGNFEDLLIGYWGGVDIVPNPYETNVYKKGGVYVLALQDYDVDVRHAVSFAYASDMTV
jgi:HK97 family phage major capsid protein